MASEIFENNAKPIIRRKYLITEILKYGAHILLSTDSDEMLRLILEFHSVENPSVGDVLEMSDEMLYYEENGRTVRNHMLAFGPPGDSITVPEDFNIQEDYAFLTYTKEDKRIKLQRYYG